MKNKDSIRKKAKVLVDMMYDADKLKRISKFLKKG